MNEIKCVKCERPYIVSNELLATFNGTFICPNCKYSLRAKHFDVEGDIVNVAIKKSKSKYSFLTSQEND